MVLGTNMVNANWENLFFSYFHENQSMPKENEIIWNHLKENPPNIFLEMHSFFQDNKTIRPYILSFRAPIREEESKILFKISKSFGEIQQWDEGRNSS